MHKLTELGALLLVLMVMGAAAFLYAGPRDQVDEVAELSQPCDR